MKIVDVYIFYDIDAWPKMQFRNFAIKNCLFGVTSILKNNDEEKYVNSGYGIAFEGKGEWNFENGTARNVIIFGVDHCSSSNSDNSKNNFLI